MKRLQLRVTPEEMLMRYPHLRERLAAQPVKQDEIEIPFDVAVSLLRTHVIHNQLKAGRSLKEIVAALDNVDLRNQMTAEFLSEVGTIHATVQRVPCA